MLLQMETDGDRKPIRFFCCCWKNIWRACADLLLRNYSDCRCILCVVFLCFWYHKSFHSIFVFVAHQLCLYAKKKTCSFLFLMILSRDLLYPAISITSSFDFSSVHHILIILLTYHISAASSLLSRSFVNVQHSHPYSRMDSVDFGVNFDISVGKDGLHLGECVFRQSYSFFIIIFVWHLASEVIVKPKYLSVSTFSPLQRILHTGMSDCFEMTMH